MKNFINRSTYLVLMAFSLIFIYCEPNDNILDDDILIEEQNNVFDPKEDTVPIDIALLKKPRSSNVVYAKGIKAPELADISSKSVNWYNHNYVLTLYTEPNFQGEDCFFRIPNAPGNLTIDLTEKHCGIDFLNNIKSYRRRNDTTITLEPKGYTFDPSSGDSASFNQNITFEVTEINISVEDYKEPLGGIWENGDGNNDLNFMIFWDKNRDLTHSAYDDYEHHFLDIKYNMSNTELTKEGRHPICSLQNLPGNNIGSNIIDLDAAAAGTGSLDLNSDGEKVGRIVSSFLTTNFQNNKMSRCPADKARSCHAQGRTCQWGALDTQGRYTANISYRGCVNIIDNTPGYQFGNSSYCTRNRYCVRTVNGAYTDFASALFDVLTL